MMNKKEFVETYGVYKTFSSLKRSDFQRGCTLWSVSYKNIHIRIEYDRCAKFWIYSSDEISYSGRFYGSLSSLKEKIASDISYRKMVAETSRKNPLEQPRY